MKVRSIGLVVLFVTIILCNNTVYSFRCGDNNVHNCMSGQICLIQKDKDYQCVYRYDDITIEQNITNSWINNERDQNILVQVLIKNNNIKKTIENMVLGTINFNPSSIWGSGLQFDSNLDEIKIDQISITPFKTYHFGYISKSDSPASFSPKFLTIIDQVSPKSNVNKMKIIN
ncbi:hypothetical protein CYY_004142 [Polysphondylium violaceum]|uniref:Carbohydrate binding domain-containing protein n=1 Tax=Polysphondylium violaceum TaxID=133409 RepID=A0A8J4PVR0_9MYCE|nr:hypothetical protein CYY_004142 [Polysphondylium violaceum]